MSNGSVDLITPRERDDAESQVNIRMFFMANLHELTTRQTQKRRTTETSFGQRLKNHDMLKDAWRGVWGKKEARMITIIDVSGLESRYQSLFLTLLVEAEERCR